MQNGVFCSSLVTRPASSEVSTAKYEKANLNVYQENQLAWTGKK